MDDYFTDFNQNLAEIELDQFELKPTDGESSGSGGVGQHRRLWVIVGGAHVMIVGAGVVFFIVGFNDGRAFGGVVKFWGFSELF